MIVLDTSAAVQLIQHADRAVVTVLADQTTRPILSYVSVGELMAGVEMATTQGQRDVRRETLRLSLLRFAVRDLGPAELVDFATARRWGLRGNDAWVAATAKSLGAMLLTCDQRQADLAAPMLGAERTLFVAPTNPSAVAG